MVPMVDLSEFSVTGAVRVRTDDELISEIVVPLKRSKPKEALQAESDLALPISYYADSHTKRAFDLVFGAMIFALALPVLIAIAVAIWLEDGGPVFFTQPRAGKGGKPFAFLKFRSMVRDAEARKAALKSLNESSDGVIFKMRRDPRITRVGAFIRRTSLDELPQILHVLSGRMSIVGPRPHPVAEVETYSADERDRLAVKPGLTCLWQVMGRSDIPFRQQMILDRLYIRHQSLSLDLKILLKTIPAVLGQRGAY